MTVHSFRTACRVAGDPQMAGVDHPRLGGAQDVGDARAKAEEADRARVRAEATSDTLREVLDSLRDSARKPDQPGKS